MGETPNDAEVSSSPTDRWAIVGRRLARARLEHHATAIAVALRTAATSASEGDLAAAELRRCYDALDTAAFLLDELAVVPADVDRPADVALGSSLEGVWASADEPQSDPDADQSE